MERGEMGTACEVVLRRVNPKPVLLSGQMMNRRFEVMGQKTEDCLYGAKSEGPEHQGSYETICIYLQVKSVRKAAAESCRQSTASKGDFLGGSAKREEARIV